MSAARRNEGEAGFHGGFAPVALSVVVPVLDEAGSLRPLHREIADALDGAGLAWEVVYVDDGSTDESPGILAELTREDPRARVVTLDGNHGQSTALLAGIQASRAGRIATLDADGQNDPRDLPVMWEALEAHPVDGVIGFRARRADSWVRRISSRIANAVRNRALGDRVTDVGCSTRVVSRAALLSVPRFEGMHRFLPTLVRARGYTLIEIPARHRPRVSGRSKYGIHNRLWRGLADLWRVRRLIADPGLPPGSARGATSRHRERVG